MNVERLSFDVVVAGGGLAGVCAAIASSRHGAKTALIQDRPVFGGNSSSEIRIPPGGANMCSSWARETGIIDEILTAERAENHGIIYPCMTNSVYDLKLYEWVKKEKNLTFFLNTRILQSITKASKILSVSAVQSGTEKNFEFSAKIFIDCTGDGTLGFLSGAEFRMGREARGEFNESRAPLKPDEKVQGSTLMLRAVNMGYPVPFTPPAWAKKYTGEEYFIHRDHARDFHGTFAGWWWLEIGVPFNTITDNETIRDELLAHVLGIWDHIKNYGDHGSENYALDWVSMVVGKRESRRLAGPHVLTENDVRGNIRFEDRIAYGGWTIDIHTMGGILAKGKPPINYDTEPEKYADIFIRPYSIPLRCLYSKNIKNLYMAGRDISATHRGLGSPRLMLTCSVMGQAAGTAAAMSVNKNAMPSNIYNKYIRELQQTLVKDDCFILDCPSHDQEDIALNKKVNASSEAKLDLNPVDKMDPLDKPRQMIIPVSNAKIDLIKFYVASCAKEPVDLKFSLYAATDIWDRNDKMQTPVFKGILSIPADFSGWIQTPVNLNVIPESLLKIELEKNPDISWARSPVVPGVAAAYKVELSSWWMNIHDHVYAVDVTPGSYPFNSENVINGTARPEKWPNLWISEKHLPQEITVDLEKENKINTVYLTFDTNLNIDMKGLHGFWKADECVKDYRLFIKCGKRWVLVEEVKGNYFRRRIHRFKTVKASAVKLEVLSTNGADSARLYEMRVYNE